MSKSKSRKKKAPKRVLALPDFEHAKTAVLNSLTSAIGQRTYRVHGRMMSSGNAWRRSMSCWLTCTRPRR